MNLNDLYFIKFRHSADRDQIVFLLTAADPADAEAKGREFINPEYRDAYALETADVVCQTPATVDCYEPV